jgi:Protein of unknown function (DUF3054)
VWDHEPVPAVLDLRRVPRPLLVGADALAFMVFVLAGLREHGELTTMDALARNLVPLLCSWFAVGWATGVYRRADARSLLLTWVVAVPLGLAIRTVWVGTPTRPGRIALFFVVAMSFTLLFLVVARAGAWLLARALGRQRARRA